MKKLKAAVVGVGNMGQHHARNYFEIKEADLVAVCDLDIKRGKEIARRYRTRFFRDYKKLIRERPDLDLASVAVPTRDHQEVACYFLNKKINVLLEKPIADSIKAGEKIIETAKKNKAKLMVGYVERFNPAVIKLKKLIDEGKLGRIISIIARRVGGFPSQIKDSNVVVDLAVHDVDIISYLLDEQPKEAYKHKAKFHTKTQEDSGEILLVYEKAAGFIQINWVTPIKIRNLAAAGTKAYAELNYITQDLIVYKAAVEKERTEFAELVKMAKPEIKKIKIKKEEPLKLEILSFIKSVREDKKPLVTGEEALESLKICLG